MSPLRDKAGLFRHDLHQEQGAIDAVEDLPERQELIERRSQGIEVTAAVDGSAAALGLFGTQVAQGAQYVATGGQVAVAPDASEAEVGDPETVESVDQEVRRLDVAVQDLVAVGIVERLGRLPAQLGNFPRRQPAQVPARRSRTTSARLRPSINLMAK